MCKSSCPITQSEPHCGSILFTFLLICAECGHRLAGIKNGHYCYTGAGHIQKKTCPHKKQIKEEAVEAWLFSFLGDELEKQRLEWDTKEAKHKQAASIDWAAIRRRKLSRLKELYVNEMIDLEEYRRDYELYTSQLAERPTSSAEAERLNFEAGRPFLQEVSAVSMTASSQRKSAPFGAP